MLLASAAANANGKLHFFDRYGEKVEFVYSGYYKSPDSIMFLRDCLVVNCNDTQATKDMVYDFVSSVQRNKIYEYKFIINECDNVFGCDDLQGQELLSGLQQSRTGQRRSSLLSMAIEGVVNGIASQIGSSSTKRITDSLVSNQGKPGYPLVHIVTSNDGAPILACEIVGNTCKTIEEIVFTKHTNGDVSVGMTADPYENRIYNLYQNSVEAWLMSFTWRCVSTGTGISGHLKWSMTCGYWP